MNDLQIALLGAGIALVGGVWGYNLWQERRHKKLAEGIFKGGQPDVLLQGQGGHEGDGGGEVRSAPAVDSVAERVEPEMTPLAQEEPQDEPRAPSALPAAWVDDIADCALRIELAEAVAAPALWAVQAAWAPQLSKPLAWMGCDAASGAWKKLTAHDAGRYAHVAVALQLADRQGALSEGELVTFVDGVQRLARQFSGAVELPPPDEVLAHAQALDQFCAGVDVQLGVNVVDLGGGSFAGTKLRGLAEAAGLILREDGRFHACDDAGGELFALGNLGAELFEAESLKTLTIPGVTFMLDVPRVADGAAVFDRMVVIARRMAQALGGALVDGQRHVLGDPTIAGIRAKIGEVQRQMQASQIAPGSPRALRLFS